MYTSSSRPEIGQIIRALLPTTPIGHPAIVLDVERSGGLTLCPLTSNRFIGRSQRARTLLPTWQRVNLQKPTYLYHPWPSRFPANLVTVIHTIGWIDLTTLHTLADTLQPHHLANSYQTLEAAALDHHQRPAA